MITFDPTINLGAILQLLGTVGLLFYIGRWVGKVEERLKAVEDAMPSIRKEREDGDAAIRALVQVIAERAR